MSQTIQRNHRDGNKLRPEDEAAHGWYRFVLSYPPHLVRSYIQRFGLEPVNWVLDPFCGTGTTLVECKKLGIASVGIEPNPVACFMSGVKVDWIVEPEKLLSHAQEIAHSTLSRFQREGINDEPHPSIQRANGRDGASKLRTLPSEASALLLKDSISPVPLPKSCCCSTRSEIIETSGSPTMRSWRPPRLP